MAITLSAEELRLLSLFEEETSATVTDCLVEDDRVVFVVAPDEMGQAIGRDGAHVERIEDRLDTDVKLVEDAGPPTDFVANALAPAAVYNVTISDGEEGTVAYAEVDSDDRAVAIGTDGRNIETARTLADRHHDIDDVKLA